MDFTVLDEFKRKLQSLRPLAKDELERLRGEFIIDNTYNSNAIEGNTLTLRETALILKEGITIGEKPLRDHLEAIGHRDAFEYVMTLADSNAELTERVIKEIHSLVLITNQLSKGVYRNVPVVITGAAHKPPEPYLVPKQIEQLLLDYHDMRQTRHIIEAVAEFHLRFEGIHPFIDGNGRTGRLILNLELIKAGLLPVSIKYADRVAYYDCFDAYFSNNGDASSLVSLLTRYEIAELERYVAMLG